MQIIMTAPGHLVVLVFCGRNLCVIIVKRYDSRLLGFNVITTSGTLFILNVYLPYQCYDNYEEYCHYLGKISAITAECDTTSIINAGDFNAGKDTQFEEELLDLCDRSHLVVSDIKWFGHDSNSNISIPDVCKCTDITCSINEHTDELTTMYENIYVALRNSSNNIIQKCSSKHS